MVGGSTYGDYDGNASEGDSDIIGVKLDSDGAVEWRWQVRSGSRCLRFFNVIGCQKITNVISSRICCCAGVSQL